MGLKLSRSASRQVSPAPLRRARQISSAVRTCMAPWFSRPVSESVRAAARAASKASALPQATDARLAIAWSMVRSSASTRRTEKNATESAPRSVPFQNIGTDTAVRTERISSTPGTSTSRW